GGQIAVGVEVGLAAAVRLVEEELDALARLGAAAVGVLALLLALGVVGRELLGVDALELGRPVELAPAVAGRVELSCRMVDDGVRPLGPPPRALLELAAQRVEECVGCLAGAVG